LGGGWPGRGRWLMLRAMKLAEYRTSLAGDKPPQGLGLALQALWWEAKGDWDKAHECAQAKEDVPGCWVHAYLHRREGDAENAGYWYRRAKKPMATNALEEEWAATAEALLQTPTE
jgi:hypothetical protein